MDSNNGRTRSAQGKGSERSKSKSEPSSMGTLSGASAEHGTHPIRASRKNSNKSNTVVAGEGSLEGISGKIIGQLVEETDKQLAYHKEQIKALEERRRELQQISEDQADKEPE